MPEISERVQLIQAIFAGLKDLGLVVASVATIWIQSGNAAKLDVQAVKTDKVQTELEAGKELESAKYANVLKAAEEAANKAELAAKETRDWRTAYERPREPAAAAPPP